MVDVKSEFEFTSSTPSYSGSPKHPAYYVQSPSSGYSNSDGSRLTSVQASPAYISSATDSPLHSSIYGRSSNPRSSSASRTSGNWRYVRVNRKRGGKPWPDIESRVIREEDDQRDEALSLYVWGFLAAALVLVSFCFIIWCASRPYKPQIHLKSLEITNFDVGEGSDRTGVPTKFVTVNGTTTMSIYNPATFFGVYISFDVDLTYLEIRVATGEVKGHYQPRTSSRNITMALRGRKVPLYGAGASLEEDREVPLKLDMEMESCGYLLGGLVKTRHHKHVSCPLIYISQGTNDIQFQQDSCTYDDL